MEALSTLTPLVLVQGAASLGATSSAARFAGHIDWNVPETMVFDRTQAKCCVQGPTVE